MANKLQSLLAAATSHIPGGNNTPFHIFLAAVAALAGGGASGLPALIFVSPSGSDVSGARGTFLPFATVQAAWNAAQSGDTIILLPGTYDESVVFTAAANKDDITVWGWGEAIIAGVDSDPALTIESTATGNNAFFTRMTVRGVQLTSDNAETLRVLGPNSTTGLIAPIFGTATSLLTLQDVNVLLGGLVLQNVGIAILNNVLMSGGGSPGAFTVNQCSTVLVQNSRLLPTTLTFIPTTSFSTLGRGNGYSFDSGCNLASVTLTGAPDVTIAAGASIDGAFTADSGLSNYFSAAAPAFNLAPEIVVQAKISGAVIVRLPTEAVGGSATPIVNFDQAILQGALTFGKANAGVERRTLSARGAIIAGNITVEYLADGDIAGATFTQANVQAAVGQGRLKREVEIAVVIPGAGANTVTLNPAFPTGTLYSIQLTADDATANPVWGSHSNTGFSYVAAGAGNMDVSLLLRNLALQG